jgi:hypothetical protein
LSALMLSIDPSKPPNAGPQIQAAGAKPKRMLGRSELAPVYYVEKSERIRLPSTSGK